MAEDSDEDDDDEEADDDDNDDDTREEEYLDCTGRKRRFVLQAYAGGMFLSATELLKGEASGMHFVLKMDLHDHVPWGEMRDKLRRRLAERDVAVDPDTKRLQILTRRVRARIVGFDDDGPILVVDDRRVTWPELARMLESYEGWDLDVRILGATEV
jgi:hypothetical protein